jgi:hypothetical protein
MDHDEAPCRNGEGRFSTQSPIRSLAVVDSRALDRRDTTRPTGGELPPKVGPRDPSETLTKMTKQFCHLCHWIWPERTLKFASRAAEVPSFGHRTKERARDGARCLTFP